MLFLGKLEKKKNYEIASNLFLFLFFIKYDHSLHIILNLIFFLVNNIIR